MWSTGSHAVHGGLGPRSALSLSAHGALGAPRAFTAPFSPFSPMDRSGSSGSIAMADDGDSSSVRLRIDLT
jgi:hypothetical protein